MALRFNALVAARGYRQDDVAERSGPHPDPGKHRTLLARTDVNKIAKGKSAWTARREVDGVATAFGLVPADVVAYVVSGTLPLDVIVDRCQRPLGPRPPVVPVTRASDGASPHESIIRLALAEGVPADAAEGWWLDHAADEGFSRMGPSAILAAIVAWWKAREARPKLPTAAADQEGFDTPPKLSSPGKKSRR